MKLDLNIMIFHGDSSGEKRRICNTLLFMRVYTTFVILDLRL